MEALLLLPGALAGIRNASGLKEDFILVLIWVAMMHDIGKAAERFQMKNWEVQALIAKLLGRPAPPRPGEDIAAFDHAIEGGVQLLEPVLDHMIACGHFPDLEYDTRKAVRGLLKAAFAHHGHHDSGRGSLGNFQHDTSSATLDAACEMAERLWLVVSKGRPAFDLNLLESLKQPVTVMHLVSGWCALADWIGSDELSFPHVECHDFAQRYPDTDSWSVLYGQYLESAKSRLQAMGLNYDVQLRRWERAVMGKWTPNDEQIAMERAARTIVKTAPPGSRGGLLILEAPMGVGKTEAAKLAAGTFVEKGWAQGLAFALPTQAATNQIYRRLSKFAEETYVVRANLAHGQAKVARAQLDELAERSARKVLLGEEIDQEAAAHLDEWLTEDNKRAFLAPITVATVDQMELMAMHSKHAGVRAATLSRQVVIIDEVHAYDAYVSRILVALLEQLGAAGTPVILLSATLPVVLRARFASAYAKGQKWDVRPPAANSNAYPLITSISSQGWKETPIPWTKPKRTVWLGKLNDGNWLDRVGQALEAGECVAVLCNTRKSARERFLRARKRWPDRPITYLHAQYRGNDRLHLQRRIEERLGSDSTPAQRRGQLVIATQVLEQSIDVDFDLMISEPAPADLMLQRMGRLHRHDRPYRTCKPWFYFLEPLESEDANKWWHGGSRTVYSEAGKLESSLHEFRQILNHKNFIVLPDDIPLIVANVYGRSEEEVLTADQALKRDLAAHRALRLDMEPDDLVGEGEESSATRAIDTVAVPILFVEERRKGEYFVHTHEGPMKLPPLMSAGGRRVNMQMLAAAQGWVYRAQYRPDVHPDGTHSIPAAKPASDADRRLLDSQLFRLAVANDWRTSGGFPAPAWGPDFYMVRVREVLWSSEGRVRLELGEDTFGNVLAYDSEQGLIDRDDGLR